MNSDTPNTPLQFRCRHIRSGSCMSQSKTAMNHPNSTKKEKQKLQLNIPRKFPLLFVSEPQKLEQLNPINGLQIKPLIKHRKVPHRQSLSTNANTNKNALKISLHSLHSDETIKQDKSDDFTQVNDSKIINGHKTSMNNGSRLMDRSTRILQKDCQSKATMKNPNAINLRIRSNKNQQQQIKTMLMQLADGHQEMMAMLKHIIRRDNQNIRGERESSDDQFEPSSKGKHIYRKIQTKTSSKKEQQRLKINQVYNEIISSSSPNQSQLDQVEYKLASSMKSSNTKKLNQESLQGFGQRSKSRQTGNFQKEFNVSLNLNCIIENVLMSNINSHPIQTTQMGFRELISRRFQAFHQNYNSFMENLISSHEFVVLWQDYVTTLTASPFLLDQEQIQVVRQFLMEVNKPRDQILRENWKNTPSENKLQINSAFQPLSISILADKMRCFIYQRMSLDGNVMLLKLLQLKNILTLKRPELEKKCLQKANNRSFISLEELQQILIELRLESVEIEIIISKLCVQSKSIDQLKFMLCLDPKWIEGLTL